MNQQPRTHSITRRIRVGLVAMAVAGTGLLGFAGVAGAITPPKLPTRCGAPVSLSTTYTYSYWTSNDQVISLSGSGCSQSANPVVVAIPELNWSTTVTPTLEPGTFSYPFSFTDSNVANQSPVGGSRVFLNQSAANAASPEHPGFPFTVNYDASQAATGGTNSIGFTLYSANPSIP
jgi:hypothetical protein